MDNLLTIDGRLILDSLGDGVYVTDLERKITYWNKAAERITGWGSRDSNCLPFMKLVLVDLREKV